MPMGGAMGMMKPIFSAPTGFYNNYGSGGAGSYNLGRKKREAQWIKGLKGLKTKSKKVFFPISPPTVVQPPQCSSSPCPVQPVPPVVQCPPVQCPEVHCPPVQCPSVQCPEVHCPTVICNAPEPDDDDDDDDNESCNCNPETPLSPVSSQYLQFFFKNRIFVKIY